ncbi:hypothetical protein VP01_1797g3 [Puccinia sorghi]|uniref:Uncharacterized protein n=1 Tax=Puccinia sorghi TaxID=27349 RepID=A0A0L6VEE8_9BASI|nr:hypothetical protein VP01_1797g3 [Puccinia sorghi]
MPWNSAQLPAWYCCIYTMAIVRAHPYLQDVVEGRKLTPGLDSSVEDFPAPFLPYDGLNQEGFINHKQPQGLAAHYQPGFSNSNPQWPGWNIDHDYPCKKNSLAGCCQNSNLHAFGHMFQSMPTHEFERPQEDSNVFQLNKELLSFEFQDFNDLRWLSSLEHVEPASLSPPEQQLVPGVLIPEKPGSQLMTSHEVTWPHNNLIVSGKEMQLISEPQTVDDLSWLFTPRHDHQPHPSLPEPLFLPQAQESLKQHPAIENYAQSSNDYAQSSNDYAKSKNDYAPRGAHNQIQSGPTFSNHENRQDSSSSGLVNGGSLQEHPIGELSEQLDKNSAPVHSMSWDPELAQLTIPNDSIDEEILREINQRFESRAGDLLEVNNLKQLPEEFAHLTGNLPVTLYIFPMKPLLFQIKVELSPEFIKNDIKEKFSGLNYRQKIMKQVTSLISWLLYIDAAVMRNLDPKGTISTNQKLVDWIFNQIFEPQNSLPVIGRFSIHDIQAITKALKFGPIQIMLITLLSSTEWSIREPQTAVMIMSHYYESEFPELSCALKSGPLPDLRSLAIQSKNLDIRIGGCNEEENQGRVWFCFAGSYMLIKKAVVMSKLEKFMSHLNICHYTLLRHIKKTKFKLGFELKPFLINWIDQVLFDLNQNKLPLLGNFVLKDGKSIYSLSPEDFNPIQRLLISLITSQDSYRRNFQAALSVFGYLLKNRAGQIYSQLFKNDKEYWDILTQEMDTVYKLKRKS